MLSVRNAPSSEYFPISHMKIPSFMNGIFFSCFFFNLLYWRQNKPLKQKLIPFASPFEKQSTSHEKLNFKLSSTIWCLLHIKIISEILWTSSYSVTLELTFPQDCGISKTDLCLTTLPYSTCLEFYLCVFRILRWL